MLRKSFFILLGLGAFLLLSFSLGTAYFSSKFFKDIPNYLSIEEEDILVNFSWSEGQYGDYLEPHDIIKVPVRIKGVPHQFYMQFDTGAPSSIVYGNTINSLIELGFDIPLITNENHQHLQNFELFIDDNLVRAERMNVLNDYGKSFNPTDSTQTIKIGTIGADFLENKISIIDFKNETISLSKNRPEWLADLGSFTPFEFKGRRIMLPAEMDGKTRKLFYDSGSSAFSFITTKNRCEDMASENSEEIRYEANSWGSSVPICHMTTEKKIKFGETNLDVRRVSYIDMYTPIQSMMAPFSKVDGWLGNKTFTESKLVLDTKEMEFMVIDQSTQEISKLSPLMKHQFK